MNDSHKEPLDTEPSDPLPQREALPEDDEVRILPSEFFFIERVEIPAALEAGELDDFAELSIESLAPFPLEQLYWGFLCDLPSQSLILYATPRERLKRAGHESLESYTWVLPDFACLLGARFAETVDVVLQTTGPGTRLQFSGGEGLPLLVEALAAGNAASDPPASTSTPRLELRLTQLKTDEKARPTFEFETLGGPDVEGHWSPLSPDEAALWRADIRPADFKASERSSRRTTAWISRLLSYAALFACLLIVLEGLLWAGQAWLDSLENKIAAQTTAVRRVEDKQSLTNKLEQVAQNELRPIAILEAANQIRLDLGNTGIEYDEAVIEGSNRITIEGKANTINELNAYTDSLKASGTFTLVGSPRQITRSGKTTFSVTLDYEHPPAEDDSTPEADVEDATEDTEESPDSTE